MKKMLCLLLLLLAATVMLLSAGCEWRDESPAGSTLGEGTETKDNTDDGQQNDELRFVEYRDYDGLLARIDEIQSNESVLKRFIVNTLRNYEAMSDTADDALAEEAAEEISAPSKETGEDAGSYSSTNVQVEGVDEGDIVKTDGHFIYMLHDNELVIFEAMGAKTVKLGSYAISVDSYDRSGYLCGMYISGDTVIIERSNYYYIATNEQVDYDGPRTETVLLDVKDKKNISEICTLSQDGSYTDSRLYNGKVYVVSSYAVWEHDADDVSSYVPAVYTQKYGAEERCELIPAGDICITPANSTDYAVLCVIDPDKREIIDSQSALGGGQTVYMNAGNLYLADTEYIYEDSDERTEDNYTVVDRVGYQQTQLLRYQVAADGSLEYAAGTALRGNLDSQFSLDEYENMLRVVVNSDEAHLSMYTDKKHGWVNYDYDQDVPSSTSVYVLDQDLHTVGSLEGLAEDEYVYSVRFIGDVVYFCTFRQTDPLFAVDLSDPAAPVVLSELKISGFSDYLHPYGEDLLFGIGMEADEESGRTECLKLVMFDISDPGNVSVAASLKLDNAYFSEALYNHRAILIDAKKALIGFPSDNGYMIYTYGRDGFVKRTEITFDQYWWSFDSRGLYIGDYFYICGSNGITVLDIASMKKAAVVNL